jgi:hypothetical protein
MMVGKKYQAALVGVAIRNRLNETFHQPYMKCGLSGH